MLHKSSSPSSQSESQTSLIPRGQVGPDTGAALHTVHSTQARGQGRKGAKGFQAAVAKAQESCWCHRQPLRLQSCRGNKLEELRQLGLCRALSPPGSNSTAADKVRG